jgi:hypothetical protein
MRIRLKIRQASGECDLYAHLEDTPTVSSLIQALPCSSTANTWGDEVYFRVPVKTVLEPNATDVVEPGIVCFWVEGSSVAIPFGPTPLSSGDECRLITQVNLLGRLEGDPSQLNQVNSGDTIEVELV